MTLIISLLITLHLSLCFLMFLNWMKFKLINDLSPTAFDASPTPIMYPHSSEHGEVDGKIRTCIGKVIKGCQETWPLYNLSPRHWREVVACTVFDHGECWRNQSGGWKMAFLYIKCVSTNCLFHPLVDVGTCVNKCCEKYF